MENFDTLSNSLGNTRISTATNIAKPTATVPKDELCYDMEHKKQGLAYIFTHHEFLTNDQKRNAANVDEEILIKCLDNFLGFDVQVFKDLKTAEIEKHINDARQMDHTDNNCFLLFVLSHGDENIIQSKDGTYDPKKTLWDQFTADNCPSLAGKPKLFFLQCCQGVKLDPGTKLEFSPQRLQRTETDGHAIAYTIPNYSDILIMYATAKGHYAFRNGRDGSYFVKCFCEELEKYAYLEHLLTILTFVTRRVAMEFESKCKDESFNKKKQNPYFESSLTRLVQFVNMYKRE